MIDLETMSTAKDAAIVSIGAVCFDIDDGTIGDTFYRVVNLKSSIRGGGKVDGDTMIWWLGQGDDARKALVGDDSVLIESALKQFSEWFREKPVVGLWGNGSDFDNVVLENAYHRLSWTPPWTYTMNRCYRTIAALFPEITRETFRSVKETHHNALDDAIVQARHLCAIWGEFMEAPKRREIVNEFMRLTKEGKAEEAAKYLSDSMLNIPVAKNA